MSKHRSRPIKKGTLKYLNSAIEFFKKEMGINEIDCEISFLRYRDTEALTKYFWRFTTLGSYDIVDNKIEIEGCDYYPRNQLVKTLFHELTHYWQAKVIKKLRRVKSFRNGEFCQDHYGDKSLINDWYHMYPSATARTFYDTVDTTNIPYYIRPHEIEARKMADQMFEKWNVPTVKGKI